MLATIALGAAQNPVGVAIGATAGHLFATFIAVIGGSLISKKISERFVAFAGGCSWLLLCSLLSASFNRESHFLFIFLLRLLLLLLLLS